eukprot:2579132-Rhodomonas_salina.4
MPSMTPIRYFPSTPYAISLPISHTTIWLVPYAISLPISHSLSQYHGNVFGDPYALSGTELVYVATSPYATSGTEPAAAATRCLRKVRY